MKRRLNTSFAPALFAWCGILLISVCVSLPAAAESEHGALNIYSARKEQLIKPLLDRWSRATGVKVNLVTGKADALLARLKTEGENTPADVFLTTDVGRLFQAQRAGLLQAIDSAVLRANIPAQYRDPDGHWFGLSLRARVFVVPSAAYDAGVGEHLRDYEDLADARWKGKICIRSSSNIYNQSLVASLIENNGAEATFAWAQKLVGNFARPPTGGDRDQILAAFGGLCDVAVANTYYLAMMLRSKNDEQRKAAQAMRIIWPNQGNRGAHINISGAGVTASSSHRANAIALIEYLAEDEAQKWYADVNSEFPVARSVKAAAPFASWNGFRRDTLPLARLGALNIEAVKLMDRAGWR